MCHPAGERQGLFQHRGAFLDWICSCNASPPLQYDYRNIFPSATAEPESNPPDTPIAPTTPVWPPSKQTTGTPARAASPSPAKLRRAPCYTAPMDVQAFLDRVRGQSWYDGQVVDDRTLPPRDAVQQALEYPLHPTLEARLEELGRWPLYAHQAAAIDAALEGQNVVVATPAASGKSLCFQAPVLHEWLEDRSSRALLLYPTKALAQDQLTALRELAPTRPAPALAVYDGDTPHDERAGIRRSAHVLLTNPDMLHAGILPKPQELGRLPAAPRHRRHRRGPHLPWRLRLPRVAAPPPPATHLRPLRRRAPLHPLLGHHRQPGGAGREPHRRALHRRHRERRPPRREALPLLEPAPPQRRVGRP